jgi:hypothetical protein
MQATSYSSNPMKVGSRGKMIHSSSGSKVSTASNFMMSHASGFGLTGTEFRKN